MPRPDRAPASVRKLTASAFAGMFVFGIVMAILGAALPTLFEKIGFGPAAAGSLFLSMNFAMLVMTVFFGPLVDRFGFKALLLVSSLLVAASFLLLAGAATFQALVAAVVVLGLGGVGSFTAEALARAGTTEAARAQSRSIGSWVGQRGGSSRWFDGR